MTKEQYIEFIQRWLGGGDAPADIVAKYDYKLVEKYVESVFEKMIINLYNSDESPSKSSLNSYIKAYPTQAITTDSDTGEKIAAIPASKLLPIPINDAIRHVGPADEPGTKYWYREINSIDVWSELEVTTTNDDVRYYVQGSNIVFDENIGSETEVLIKLVVPFSEYDDDEVIYMPLGSEVDMLSMIVELIRQKPPKDTKPDGNTEQIIK